jgi:hypothetical protein
MDAKSQQRKAKLGKTAWQFEQFRPREDPIHLGVRSVNQIRTNPSSESRKQGQP